MVKKIETNSLGNKALYCIGISPLVKDKEAIFLTDLEQIQIVNRFLNEAHKFSQEMIAGQKVVRVFNREKAVEHEELLAEGGRYADLCHEIVQMD